MEDKNNKNIERQRMLAIMKSSNQLLEESRQKMLRGKTDPLRIEEINRQFDKAIEENKIKAMKQLDADNAEVESAEYRTVSPEYIDKYKKRLELRGITDELIHQKDGATVSVGQDKNTETKKVRRKRGKSDRENNVIVRLDNEEELMRKSLVTDEKQIDNKIHENKEKENENVKINSNKFEKLKKIAEEDNTPKKVNVYDDEERGLPIVEDKSINNKKEETEIISYDFDFSSIPSYIQYDVLPLPSNGRCYPVGSPLRCGRVPVAYLTASDENLIASPNMYRDGKLLDIILERKILDKRINVNDLVGGDRDAIILWLRATAYGDDFNVITSNPLNGKQYNVTIKLSDFKYNKFDLDSDENGMFDFITSNSDRVKFKFFTKEDNDRLRKMVIERISALNKVDVIRSIRVISDSIGNLNISDDEQQMLREDIDEIKDIVGEIDDIDDNLLPVTVTEQMLMHTVSINGNEDRQYIRKYIENMRTLDSKSYRNYINDNKPGIDFTMHVQIPESEGGGSFDTTFLYGDTIFIS